MSNTTIEDVADGAMVKSEIASPQDLSNAIYQLVHHAIVRYSGNDGMKACEVAATASLAPILNLALLICKKPDDLRIGMVPKDRAAEVYRSITAELLVFASLMVANQYGHIKDHSEDEMAMAAEFGYHIFGRALAQWQKLYPNLMIEDYVESPVAVIAKTELNNPANFHTAKNFDHRFLMRNNGSVN